MIQLSKKFILGVLAFALVLVFYAVLKQGNQRPQVVFLDVGQGDAELITLPKNIQILIDGGPSDKILTKLSKYLPFYDKDIELVVLTHPHSDHLRGLVTVVKNYNVKNVLWSGARYDSRIYNEWIEALKNENANIYVAKRGDKISWRGAPLLEVLSPQEIVLGKIFKKIHDSTVVAQLDLGGKKFLLMGDAEENLEKELLALGLGGDIDVLKIGHHGSRTSTSAGLLRATRPRETIIEVGRNSYGHPHAGVLDRLRQFGATILRTDKLGDIIYQ